MSSKANCKDIKKDRQINKKIKRNSPKLVRQASAQVFEEISRLTKKENYDGLKVLSSVISTISKEDSKSTSTENSSVSKDELSHIKYHPKLPVPIQSMEDLKIKPSIRIDNAMIKEIKQKLKQTKSKSLAPKTKKAILKPKKVRKRILKEPKYLDQSNAKCQKPICRICCSSKCTVKTGELIVPCNCRGIFSTVHQNCISDWIVSMCSEMCDVCRFKFLIKAKHKGVCDFIKEEHQLKYLWRFAVVTAFSLYLILISSSFVLVNEHYSLLDDKLILIHKNSSSLLVFILLAYVGYYLTERVIVYRKWRKYKYHITVKSNPNYKITELITPPLDTIRSSGLGQHSIKPLTRPAF